MRRCCKNTLLFSANHPTASTTVLTEDDIDITDFRNTGLVGLLEEENCAFCNISLFVKDKLGPIWHTIGSLCFESGCNAIQIGNCQFPVRILKLYGLCFFCSVHLKSPMVGLDECND